MPFLATEEESAGRLARPSVLMGGLHLLALWTLAVVQPLLSLLGSNADFFVARDNTGLQIALFVLLLTFVPPLVAWAIEILLNLVSEMARWIFHLILVAFLLSVLSMDFLKALVDFATVPMFILAIAGGLLLTLAYARMRFMRSLTDILVVAPLIILVTFFFFSDTAELVTSSGDVEPLEVKINDPAPVVMIVFDEFPVGSLMTPDHQINRKRFPHFAELQADSNWYRNTATDASYTALAVPSILTGTTADPNKLPTAQDHPDSIFTLLGGSYRVNAVEPITHLCPPSVCGEDEDADEASTGEALSSLFEDLKYVEAHVILPESMGPDLPDISQSFSGFGGSATDSIERGRARQFVRDQLDSTKGEDGLDGEGDLATMLKNRKPAASNTFDFAHVEEPHYPWTHYPNGMHYTSGTEDFRDIIGETEWLDDGYLTDRAHQSHLLEVGFADHLLGRVMDRIKKDGLWDKTMIVVAADHGGAMTKGVHRREAHPETMGQIGWVPFFVKAPGQKAGRIVDRVTCVTEILPIVASNLGTTLPWDTPACNRNEMAIDNGTGPVVRTPIARALKQRDDYIATLTDLFGGDTGFPSVLKLDPNKALIGDAISSFTVAAGPPDGASVDPDLSGALASDFEPTEELNPLLRQRGQLNGVPVGTPLAVAVNGKIAATGQSYDDRGSTLYSMLLPVESLSPGSNDIQLFRVDRGRGLTPLWASGGQ